MANSSDTGTAKRGRGRPPGSKNKPKIGRPKGSKSGYTVSEKALAQRKAVGIQKVKPAETPEEMAYNTRLIQHIMQVNEIASHADKNDILSLRSCFIAYLQLCQQDGFPVQNLTAYASMGFPSNAHFENYAKKDNPEIRIFCASVKQTCAMYRESLISSSKINPVIGIFWQRNYDGLRNDTEQVQAVQEQNDDEYSGSKSYKDKYRDMIGG